MAILTKESDYAVRALMNLALSEREYTSAKEIAAKESIPYYFLRKILRVLREQGIVRAKEGAGGGVKLMRSPEKIRVSDIMNIFQESIRVADCMFRKKVCVSRHKCVLRKRLQVIEKSLIEMFEEITILSLITDLKKAKEK